MSRTIIPFYSEFFPSYLYPQAGFDPPIYQWLSTWIWQRANDLSHHGWMKFLHTLNLKKRGWCIKFLTFVGSLAGPVWLGWVLCRPVNAFLRMRSHGRKRWKTFKNQEKIKKISLFFFMRPTWASHVHDRKSTFFIISQCFWSFSSMPMHAQACICCSKYTTVGLD